MSHKDGLDDLCRVLPTVHQWRQHFRMADDAWTLPAWLCFLYWFGAERLAPKRLRITWAAPDTIATRLWLTTGRFQLSADDKDWINRQLDLVLRHRR